MQKEHKPSLRRWLFAGLWHVLPLLCLAAGMTYGVVAALGLVALPYVKVRKLRQQALNLEGDAHPSTRLREEAGALRTAADRWAYLTLPWPAAPAEPPGDESR